jgi:hypothetical protein
MARNEYLEVETGVVRYECCSATGEIRDRFRDI